VISPTGIASSGASAALYFHWTHRPLLLWLPSFSMEAEAGRRKTSVLTFAGSTPGPFQKQYVSLSKIFSPTSQSRFSRALRTLAVLGELTAGSVPTAKRPLILPLYISSKRCIREVAFPSSSLGSQE